MGLKLLTERIGGVYKELFNVPRPVNPVKESDINQRYFRVTASDLLTTSDIVGDGGSPQSNSGFAKTFEAGGDCFFVEDISGSTEWGVRLGRSDNPIIRLYPGRVIRRRFNRFTLYTLTPPYQQVNPAFIATVTESKIEVLISTGSLIEIDGQREAGLGPRSNGQVDAVATTTPRYISTDYQTFGYDVFLHPGQRGGSLLLRNSDLTNTLYIGLQWRQALGTTIQDIWRLYPGEVLTIPMSGEIQHPVGTNTTLPVGIVVYTKVGTCKYDWLMTRIPADWTDPIQQPRMG